MPAIFLDVVLFCVHADIEMSQDSPPYKIPSIFALSEIILSRNTPDSHIRSDVQRHSFLDIDLWLCLVGHIGVGGNAFEWAPQKLVSPTTSLSH